MLIVPWAFPAIVLAFSWRFMLDPIYGVTNHILMVLGLISGPVPWLTTPGLAMPAMVLINIWFGFPFMMVAITAALTMIPRELYEAGKIDGTSYFDELRHITLPLILPVLGSLIILRTIFVFNNFDFIFLTTRRRADRCHVDPSGLCLSDRVAAIRPGPDGCHLGDHDDDPGRHAGGIYVGPTPPASTAVTRTIAYLILAALCAFAMFPLVWMIATSLKSYADVYVFPPRYLPQGINFGFYRGVMQDTPFFSYMVNSAIVTSCATVLSVSFGAMAAGRWRGPVFAGVRRYCALCCSPICCRRF